MKKLSNTEAELKKKALLIKKACISTNRQCIELRNTDSVIMFAINDIQNPSLSPVHFFAKRERRKRGCAIFNELCWERGC